MVINNNTQLVGIDALLDRIGGDDSEEIYDHLTRVKGMDPDTLRFEIRTPTSELDKRCFINVYSISNKVPKFLGDYIIFFEEGPYYRDSPIDQVYAPVGELIREHSVKSKVEDTQGK
jgi:hypothetical protein